MASAHATTPHPLLTSPVLYVADVHEGVKWSHLIQVFKSCGFVRSGGKSTIESGRTRWTIMFTDVFHAEMALATLQGAEVPGISPTCRLTLSHASLLSSSVPKDRLFPQYFKGSAHAHGLLSTFSAQEVFGWFRRAGPLVSVRVNVMIGHAYPTCVVEYWDEKHARYAWIHCRVMDPALAAFKPSFELHTYNPCALTCTGFGTLWRQPDLYDAFTAFGKVTDVHMIKVGVPDAYGVVSYSTAEGTEKALQALAGKVIGTKKLSVRYSEPEQQGTFRPAFASRAAQSEPDQRSGRRRTSSSSSSGFPDCPDAQKRPGGPRPPHETRPNGATCDARLEKAEECERLAKLEQEAAESEERAAQSALTSATQEHDDARAKQAEADAAVEEAERILLEAKERQLQSMHRVIQGLEKKNEAAQRERDAGRRRKEAVQDAVLKKVLAEEARRLAQEPGSGPNGAEQSSSQEGSGGRARANGDVPEWRSQARRRQESMRGNQSPPGESAWNRGRWGFQPNDNRWGRNTFRADEKPREGWYNGYRETPTEDAESDEEKPEKKAGLDENEERHQQDELREEEARMREEVERRSRLEESIRKMKLMREQEESDRLERQRKTQLEEERKQKEADRVAREERERQAREEAEREAKEAHRRKVYEEAVSREKTRCEVRDRELWNIIPMFGVSSRWTPMQSINRFQGISTEFDTIKFCDSQPVTFASIPWPILSYPPHVMIEDIEWNAVEQFFSAAKRDLDATEYKSMVEKAHRRFHPDKWRSRGLLRTVLDEELRKHLEDAGNVVAQAITPLWLASKAK